MPFANETCKTIETFECPYCHEQLVMNKRQYANHIRWCKANPKYQEIRDNMINKIKENNDKVHNSLFHDHVLKCEICGNEYTINISDRNFNAGRYRKTCSDECAKKLTAKNSNKNIEKRICLNCGQSLNKNATKYCSFKCQQEFEQKEYIQRWKDGLETGMSGKYGISDRIRRYFFDKYDCKCQKCGWGEENPITHKVPLQIHHIDGDCLNNKEDNLQLLCPNCHSLTETFGNLNKNSSRVFRKQKENI